MDVDSPESACFKPAEREGRMMKLVFSDEFDRPGRTFIDGHDSRWTALESAPYSNEQVNYYNASHAFTRDGVLDILCTNDDVTFEVNGTREEPHAKTETRTIQTAMLQTWNKFCFSQGAVEISARMPGPHGSQARELLHLVAPHSRQLYPVTFVGARSRLCIAPMLVAPVRVSAPVVPRIIGSAARSCFCCGVHSVGLSCVALPSHSAGGTVARVLDDGQPWTRHIRTLNRRVLAVHLRRMRECRADLQLRAHAETPPVQLRAVQSPTLRAL